MAHHTGACKVAATRAFHATNTSAFSVTLAVPADFFL